MGKVKLNYLRSAKNLQNTRFSCDKGVHSSKWHKNRSPDYDTQNKTAKQSKYYSSVVFLLKGKVFLLFNLLTASLICFGFTGVVSPNCSITSNASSITSPTNIFDIPDIAMTTFCVIPLPDIFCINLLNAAFGNEDLLYISYLLS